MNIDELVKKKNILVKDSIVLYDVICDKRMTIEQRRARLNELNEEYEKLKKSLFSFLRIVEKKKNREEYDILSKMQDADVSYLIELENDFKSRTRELKKLNEKIERLSQAQTSNSQTQGSKENNPVPGQFGE